LNDHLKNFKWYAFGTTPVEIADRVTFICSTAQYVANTDFSKFDGHVNRGMRELEHKILVRAFDSSYHTDLMRIHENQYKTRAVGKHGTRYNTNYTRLSGSPETSAFNSIENAFVAYCAFRNTLTRTRDQYIAPIDAWSKLGIYGGDDGLTADLPEANYIRIAQLLGQKLTVEHIPRNCRGVKFLSRTFGPDVWQGDPSSCCDLVRAIGKFHVSKKQTRFEPWQQLILKSYNYYHTDSQTPIIGDFVTKVKELSTMNEDTNQFFENIDTDQPWTVEYISWFGWYASDNNWPQYNTLWMEDEAGEFKDKYLTDYLGLHNSIANATSLTDLLNLPKFYSDDAVQQHFIVDTPYTYEINGEISRAKEPKIDKRTIKTASPDTKTKKTTQPSTTKNKTRRGKRSHKSQENSKRLFKKSDSNQ